MQLLSADKINQIVEDITRTYSYDSKLKAGRSIEQIQESKRFPVFHYCLDQAVVIAHKLKQAGFAPEIIMEYGLKPLIRIEGHFFVRVKTAQGERIIDLTRGKTIIQNELPPLRKLIKRKVIPFNLNENQGYFDLGLTKPLKSLMAIKTAKMRANPKTWQVRLNKRKHENKEQRYTANLRQRLIK